MEKSAANYELLNHNFRSPKAAQLRPGKIKIPHSGIIFQKVMNTLAEYAVSLAVDNRELPQAAEYGGVYLTA